MTTTISGTTITFVDGSTWTGANGALITDTNTSNTAQSFNVGHLILANCIFYSNTLGYESGGYTFWALNSANSFYHIYAGTINTAPGVNTTYPANDSRLGSQSYYARGGSAVLSGTWRARGQACGAGINQTVGYFVLMERVA